MNKKTLTGAIVTGLASILAIGIKKACDNNIYDKDGFNNKGIDREGYNRQGYNKEGYDRKGYDREGYDKYGYDKNGYDKYGYDKDGYNVDERDREGYNKEGYDVEGYDRKGFNSNGYKSNGLDRSNNDKDYYMQKIEDVEKLLQSAYKEMRAERFPYALRDIRIGFEKCIKCIIEHQLGERYCEETLHRNIEVCDYKRLLDNELIEKLMGAKQHCNDAQHDTGIEKEHGQVYFSYKVLEEVLQEVRKYVI